MLPRLMQSVASLHPMSSKSTSQTMDAVLFKVLSKLTNWSVNLQHAELRNVCNYWGNFWAGTKLDERLWRQVSDIWLSSFSAVRGSCDSRLLGKVRQADLDLQFQRLAAGSSCCKSKTTSSKESQLMLNLTFWEVYIKAHSWQCRNYVGNIICNNDRYIHIWYRNTSHVHP